MTKLNFVLCRSIILGFILTGVSFEIFAQAQLILNGAIVNLNQGAYLVVDNAATSAITRNSGFIISEGENNILQWNLGTSTGTYTVPWGHGSTDYLPLTFTKSSGVGGGYFLFSTYATGWQNSAQLPTGVSNFSGALGADKSAFAVDRFWQIKALGYTTKPSLSTVVFSYLGSEFGAPNTNSTKAGLTAQRWNSTGSTWLDYGPPATVDINGNTVTIANIAESDLHPWWVVDYIEDRHWVAPASSNWNDPANWSTTAGGAGGFSVPTTIDAVSFDDVKDASFTLDMDVTVNSLVMNPGYTGTLTQGTNAITVNTDATLAGGTFVGGSGNITVAGDLQIAGTSFTSTSGTLDLKNDFTFTSGAFIHNYGTVKFSGTSGTQNIGGTVITNFNNILVSNTASTSGLSVQSDQNLAGVLTLENNVVVDADGSSNTAVLKLISTADNPTADGAIAALPAGAQVTGNVTVQRYMSIEGASGGRIYRYISSPLQNASVADLQNEIPVTGSFTGTSACSGCSGNQTMFGYNEAIVTDINGSGVADMNDGYFDFPADVNTETMVPGRGYALYVRGNILSTALWDVRGRINAGNITPVSLPVTYNSSGTDASDGWNLVGNPYPSAIDWNASNGWMKENINGAIYVSDNSFGTTQYATWNGLIGTNGGSRYIATGQAFWIKASGAGAPVLEADENVKVAGTQGTFFREAALQTLLRITLVKGVTRDETIIHFRPDATEGFDANADALKLTNGTINISSLLSDGRNLAINSLPTLNCQYEVKLNIAKPAAGSYQLDFSELDSFSGATIISLVDNFTNTTVDVRSGKYNFSVTSDAASYGAGRFKIKFVIPAASANFELTSDNVCEGTDAVVKIKGSQGSVEYSALINNVPISGTVIGNGGNIEINIPKANLQTGETVITVSAVLAGCTTTAQKNVTLAVEKRFDVTLVTPGSSCKAGPVALAASGAPVTGYYNWYGSESSPSPIINEHDSLFITPFLSESKVYYVAAVNSLGCEDIRKPVLAKVGGLVDAQISQLADSLVSNYAYGNQWYFNNQVLLGAINQSIKPDQSGVYTVEVTIDGCTTTASFEFVVTGIEVSYDKMFSVYPNPFRDKFQVSVSDSFENIREISVLNSLGSVIGSITWREVDGKATGYFDMSNYPAGVYILHIVGARGIQEAKVVKQ